MKDHPLVSTIIPTYNRAQSVCSAIESALEQTYSPIEIVVVDDGSTDDTQARLQRYGDRIRVVRQNNAGPSAARNTGVRISRGELIAFLDSDDLWLPQRLAHQVAVLLEVGKSVPCCLCDVRLLREHVEVTSSFKSAWLYPTSSCGVWLNVVEILVTRFVFFNQAALVRREAFEKLAGFDERLRFLEDYDLALRLALLGPWAFVAEELVFRQESADSLSHEARSRKLFVKERVLEINMRASEPLRDRAKLHRLITSQSRRIKREIAAVHLGEKQSRLGHSIAAILSAVERLRAALFRRSPWYPKMQTTGLEAFAKMVAPNGTFYAEHVSHKTAPVVVTSHPM